MVKIRLKNGEYYNKQLGYIMVYDPVRRMCVPKHRMVAEQRLGRRLGPNQLVHHKDDDKRNNTPSNLRVETRHDHNVHRHKKESNFYGNRNPSKHMTAKHHASLKAAWIRRKRIYGATGARNPENLRRKGYEAGLKRKT
jgi:hypothetical protein